jgi:hypothetical protein
MNMFFFPKNYFISKKYYFLSKKYYFILSMWKLTLGYGKRQTATKKNKKFNQMARFGDFGSKLARAKKNSSPKVKLHPARPVTKESNRQKGIRFYFL